ncbi:hypothetical protein V1509DRAFT_625497 [Lipomyces kononenkoae]
MPPRHPPPLANPKLAAELAKHTFDNEDGAEYAGSEFGGFGEYFRNKKIKLQNLDTHIRESNNGIERPPIFKGCIVHVNGYTKPSIGELHKLVVLYGGVFSQYMDSKTTVTHIIASSLTPKKLVEFARYRVVKPEWITQSIEAGKLLPWHDFRVIQPTGSQRRLPVGPAINEQKNDLRQQSSPSHSVSPSKSARQREFDTPSTVSPHLTMTRKVSEISSEDHNSALLVNPNTWKSTVLNPEFLKTYYGQSRLHHLSMWKANLKLKFQNQISASCRPPPKRPSDSRVIFHVDFDCFFASIALRKRPQYADKPICIGHGGNQNSEVSSCNYIARDFGVRNGMWMRRAKELCPELICLPYEFDAYEEASSCMYSVLIDVGADKIEAVSIDEALIDVSSLCWSPNDDEIQMKSHDLAKSIRNKVFELTQCHVSVGIGGNILQAKLATKWAKPAGQHRVRPNEIMQLIHGLPVEDLPGIGYSIGAQLKDRFDIEKTGDILTIPKPILQSVVGGKNGDKLYSYAHGEDAREVGEISVRKSVSAEVNWGVRFATKEQVDTFLGSLAGELSSRLANLNMIGSNITLKIYRRAENAPLEPAKYLGCGECDAFSRSYTGASPTCDPSDISRIAIWLLGKLQIPVGDIRGVGLQMTKLVPVHGEAGRQVTLFQTKSGSTEVATRTLETLETKFEEDHHSNLDVRTSAEPFIDSKDASKPVPQYFVPTEISEDVLRELPLSIQKEILWSRRPKASSDQDFVAKLQDESQRIQQYGDITAPFRRPAKRIGDQEANRLKSKRTKLGNSSKNLNTIGCYRSASKLPNQENSINTDNSWALEVDEGILKELPQDIRDEIHEERRHYLLNQPAGKAGEEPELSNAIQLQHPILTFQGKNQIDDLRDLLHDWLSASSAEMQGPHMDDVHLLEKYLYRVVTDEVNLNKAVELVKWVEFQVEKVLRERNFHDNPVMNQEVLFEWLDVVDILQKAVSTAAEKRGIYNIQFCC